MGNGNADESLMQRSLLILPEDKKKKKSYESEKRKRRITCASRSHLCVNEPRRRTTLVSAK